MALASIRKAMAVMGAVLLILLALPPPPAGRAQDPEAYTVRGVAVDRSAATAAQARDSAHAEGRRIAFRRLVERLVPRESQARVPSLNDAQLLDLIHSFEVDNERSSTVRYIADLTVTFNPAAVDALLGRSGAPASTPAATPTTPPGAAPPAGASLITVLVPVGSASELANVRQRLSQVAGISRNEVVSLTRSQATIELGFAGDPQQLAAALGQRDLVLAREGEAWRLTLRGGAARP